jgi:hypothetical protein
MIIKVDGIKVEKLCFTRLCGTVEGSNGALAASFAEFRGVDQPTDRHSGASGHSDSGVWSVFLASLLLTGHESVPKWSSAGPLRSFHASHDL